MKRAIAVAFFIVASACEAQTSIISQMADGGGWQTTLVLTNTATAAVSASLSFFQDTSAGATQSWNLPFLEVGSTQNLSLPAGGTLFLHTPGTGAATAQGWGQLQAAAGVVCYAIFTQRVSGRQDQDGTAPAAASASRILVPFDNSSGFVTSIAVVNPAAASESISVSIQTDAGATSKPPPLSIPAQGHMAFALPQQFPMSSGQRGLAEFYSASGGLSIIALRFNPTGAFTAAPVYLQTGPPIIGSTSIGELPSFSVLSITADSTRVTITGLRNGTYSLSMSADTILSQSGNEYVFVGSSDSGALGGQTFTFTSVEEGSEIVDPSGDVLGITSFNLTLTLSPSSAAPTTGFVTGTLTVADPAVSLSQSLSGTYLMYQ